MPESALKSGAWAPDASWALDASSRNAGSFKAAADAADVEAEACRLRRSSPMKGSVWSDPATIPLVAVKAGALSTHLPGGLQRS